MSPTKKSSKTFIDETGTLKRNRRLEITVVVRTVHLEQKVLDMIGENSGVSHLTV